MPERCGGSQTFVPRMVSNRVSKLMHFYFLCRTGALAGYHENQNNIKLIAKVKSKAKSTSRTKQFENMCTVFSLS